MDRYTQALFEARIEALGDTATEEQITDLVGWVSSNVATVDWGTACFMAISLDGFYTEMSMRMGECGL